MIPDKSARLLLVPGALVVLLALSVLGACTADAPAVPAVPLQSPVLIPPSGQGPPGVRDADAAKGR